MANIGNNKEAVSERDRFYLFKPGDKHQVDEYEDLKKEDIFKKTTREELRFVWAMSNYTSDYFNVKPISEKISKCYEFAFDRNRNDSEKAIYLAQSYPQHIRIAMDKMRMYNPDVRAKALKIYQSIFEKYQATIDGFNMSKKMNIDEGEARKQKVELESAGIILKDLPDVMLKIEEGFGLKLKKGSVNDDNLFQEGFNQRHKDKDKK